MSFWVTTPTVLAGRDLNEEEIPRREKELRIIRDTWAHRDNLKQV